MRSVRFGTDGVRGVAGVDLTREVVEALGRATALVVPAPSYLVGRDTRQSGPLLQASLSKGLSSFGADVIDVGILPTPGIAFLSQTRSMPAAVVSASHNPYEDNGIKIFSETGMKIDEKAERSIEEVLETGEIANSRSNESRGHLGSDAEGRNEYIQHLLSSINGSATSLAGLSIVLDCAHGAASGIAAEVFSMLGATVTAIGTSPDGMNINLQSGSTDTRALVAKVKALNADLGLAFDGDADRMVAIDHEGNLADGDVLLALFAIELEKKGALVPRGVAVTVMTNLGFRRAMAERDVTVYETPVGDRHVLAAIDEQNLALGGEQSGHIIFRRHATTGDGMLTGVLLADILASSRKPFRTLIQGLVITYPQVLLNVSVAKLEPRCYEEIWESELAAFVRRVSQSLGTTGRVVVRPSGTEPVVRVMVEASSMESAKSAADQIAKKIQTAFGHLLSNR